MIDSTPADTGPGFTRRRLLLAAGTAGITLAACGSDAPDSARDTTPDTAPAAGGASDGGTTPGCVLTPEEIEGPFYTDLDLVRSDITEGRPGTRLDLQLVVVDADGCTPIEGAEVDIWHADAAGLYSSFPGQGDDQDINTSDEQFLRGVQPTNADGIASFTTIYPGWYRGRTTHIHVKVHLDGNTQVTTQLFFPDDVTQRVYGDSAYSERGQKDTTNADDEFGGDDQNLLMAATVQDGRTSATGTLGIDRT